LLDTFTAIRTKRELREYEDRTIPHEGLLKILEAGRLAPSSKNSQPWHFIAVRNKEVLKALSRTTPTGAHLAQAPLAIAVFTENAKLPEVDGARAMQNMILAAWELGVASCWITNFDEAEVKRLLAAPEHLRLITVVPFGYPKEKKATRKKIRKRLEEIAHFEKFGQKTDPYVS
jgi:nitroreductase